MIGVAKEREILDLLECGTPKKAIMRRLHVARNTVRAVAKAGKLRPRGPYAAAHDQAQAVRCVGCGAMVFGRCRACELTGGA